MIWIQLVEILYTKASRGAPAATVRNKLPRAFVVSGADGSAPYYFEHYRLLEWKGFVAERVASRTAEEVPRQEDLLLIEPGPVGLGLGLLWNPTVGQPPRQERPRAVWLTDGDVTRLIINGRYTSHSGQVYTEATYNAAFGASLAPDVFARAEPRLGLDMRADLF